MGESIKRDWEEEYRALGSVFGRRSKTEQAENRNKGRCLQGAALQCRYAFSGQLKKKPPRCGLARWGGTPSSK